jgi:hypothetical protein
LELEFDTWDIDEVLIALQVWFEESIERGFVSEEEVNTSYKAVGVINNLLELVEKREENPDYSEERFKKYKKR